METSLISRNYLEPPVLFMRNNFLVEEIFLQEKNYCYIVPHSNFPAFFSLTQHADWAHSFNIKGLSPTWGPASLCSASLRESLSSRTSSFLRLWTWRDLRSSHSPPGRDDRALGMKHRSNLACRSNWKYKIPRTQWKTIFVTHFEICIWHMKIYTQDILLVGLLSS